MKGLYVVYTNFNREGWKKTLQTKNRDTFEYYITRIWTYDEPVSVITKYQTEKGDYPLICFHNRCTTRKPDLAKAYKLLPKN